MPPKIKVMNDPIFKTRSKPVPPPMWKQLTTRTSGADLSGVLSAWGADTNRAPIMTILITALEMTARIRGSRFIIRGLLFTVGNDNKLKANTIWPRLKEDLFVTFKLEGQALNFNNEDARNHSLWVNVAHLPSFRIWQGNKALAPAAVDKMPQCKEGAHLRVALLPSSLRGMSVHLLAVPLGPRPSRTRPKTGRSPESWLSSEASTSPNTGGEQPSIKC